MLNKIKNKTKKIWRRLGTRKKKVDLNKRVVLKRIGAEDLISLDEIRGDSSPKLHGFRISEQNNGRAIYLIAFLSEVPVGHVYLNLKGSEKYHNCPIIQDLYVGYGFRKQRVGLRIMQETEDLIKNKGFEKVGLDVETRKRWVRSFYEGLGFEFKSGPHIQSWREKDSGELVKVEVSYLEKSLY